MGRQTGITAANYQELGGAFIREHGGALIALAPGVNQGVRYEATIQQWGAWRAYFRARKIPTKFMDTRGQTGKCWTAPAAWPHEFDGEADVEDDKEAGELFLRYHRPEREDFAQAVAARAATVAKVLGYNPQERRGRYEPSKAPVERLDEANSLPLKTPDRPASDELKRLLEDQGAGHLVRTTA